MQLVLDQKLNDRVKFDFDQIYLEVNQLILDHNRNKKILLFNLKVIHQSKNFAFYFFRRSIGIFLNFFEIRHRLYTNKFSWFISSQSSGVKIYKEIKILNKSMKYWLECLFNYENIELCRSSKSICRCFKRSFCFLYCS